MNTKTTTGLLQVTPQQLAQIAAIRKVFKKKNRSRFSL